MLIGSLLGMRGFLSLATSYKVRPCSKMKEFNIIAVLGLFCTNVCTALHIADLSHSFDNSTLYWPTFVGGHFHFYKKIFNGSGPTYYAMNVFCTAEHGGTHIDAPIHFAEGKKTVGQIGLSVR